MCDRGPGHALSIFQVTHSDKFQALGHKDIAWVEIPVEPTRLMHAFRSYSLWS